MSQKARVAGGGMEQSQTTRTAKAAVPEGFLFIGGYLLKVL